MCTLCCCSAGLLLPDCTALHHQPALVAPQDGAQMWYTAWHQHTFIQEAARPTTLHPQLQVSHPMCMCCGTSTGTWTAAYGNTGAAQVTKRQQTRLLLAELHKRLPAVSIPDSKAAVCLPGSQHRPPCALPAGTLTAAAPCRGTPGGRPTTAAQPSRHAGAGAALLLPGAGVTPRAGCCRCWYCCYCAAGC